VARVGPVLRDVQVLGHGLGLLWGGRAGERGVRWGVQGGGGKAGIRGRVALREG
jgi:hypothetical protein